MKRSPIHFKRVFSSEDGNLVQFLVDGVTEREMTNVRKILFHDIPTMAIETVSISMNTTGVIDEIIAHNLSLIIFESSTADDYVFPSECPTSNKITNPECAVPFSIHFFCGSKKCVITAKDLVNQSQDQNIRPVYPKSIITNIVRGGELKAVVYVEKGLNVSGKIGGTKWSPVSGTTSFAHVPLIQTTTKISTNPFIRAFGLNGKDKNTHITIKTENQLMKEYPDSTIYYNTGKFLFTIESNGSLPMEIIIEKLEEIYFDIYRRHLTFNQTAVIKV